MAARRKMGRCPGRYRRQWRLGLLGDLEHAVAEGLQGAILAGIALRKHGDAGLILSENLDAAQNGFQGLPVVFPVDGLAGGAVHQLVDHKEALIFLLGNECQLAVGQAVVQDQRIEQAQVVADQQEPGVPGHLFQTGWHGTCT